MELANEHIGNSSNLRLVSQDYGYISVASVPLISGKYRLDEYSATAFDVDGSHAHTPGEANSAQRRNN